LGNYPEVVIMPVEVEMKFAVDDFADLESCLVRCGARKGSHRCEADHYFNAPDRDFARTDEALRLRRIGLANFLTYKGPKRDLQTKTRTEVEVTLAEGDETARGMMELLGHLQYRPVAVVRKERCSYHLTRNGFDVEICLDRVQDVGHFAELEIVAAEAELEKARGTVLDLAASLGLGLSERRSYLEMLLTARGDKR
jgi:adenylate cyclase class 2